MNKEDLRADELVRRARRESGLNTAGFGRLIGVSGRTVESWESGRYTPGGPALLIIKSMLKREDDEMDVVDV